MSCEDYGQQVVYRGTVPHHPELLPLDKYYQIERGQHLPVCANTWRMLADTRFASHFDFIGDAEAHRGAFAGGDGQRPAAQPAASSAGTSSSGCC